MSGKVINFEEKLPADEYAREVMKLTPKKRMEAILDRPDASAVVQSMAVQDFYLTVMEIGAEDALSLLSLASTEQWIHIFDMECWSKDRIVAGQGIAWLERMSRVGYEPLARWLHNVEFFFLISLIKQWIRVAVRPDDIDLTESLDYLPPHTIDDQYFWECRYTQYDDLMRHLLSILFETNYAYYKEIMEHVAFGLDAEMEEEAYRFHKGRLEDYAIPDYYDALGVFAPIEPSKVPKTKMQYIFSEEPIMTPPSFAVAIFDGTHDLFSQAILQIDNQALLEHIQLELAALSNKVIVADQVVFEDTEHVRESLEKVRATLNLGLHIMMTEPSGKVSAAADVLRQIYLEHIFRVGLGPIQKLGRRAKRLVEHGWIARCPVGINILENEWYEFLDLMLQKFPQIRRESPEMAPRLDFFRTPAEISEAADRLDTILCMGAILEAIDVPWEYIAENLWPEGYYVSLDDITVSILLFTAAAHSLLHETPKFTATPIPLKQWNVAFSKLHPNALITHIRTWLSLNIQGEQWKRHIDKYLNSLFKAYYEEMTPFYEENEIPDPRWLRFFLFKE